MVKFISNSFILSVALCSAFAIAKVKPPPKFELCTTVLNPGVISDYGNAGIVFSTQGTKADFSWVTKSMARSLPLGFSSVVLRRAPPFVGWDFAERYPDRVFSRTTVLKPEVRPRRKALEFRVGVMSPWIRDYLPVLVMRPDQTLQLVSFRYASPKTYMDLKIDLLMGDEDATSVEVFPNPFPLDRQLSAIFEIPLINSELIAHGGNLLADEQGNVFLTSKVQTDNPDLSREQIEEELRRVLFAPKIYWMPQLFGERTGHLDVYAMYLQNKRFVLQRGVEDDRSVARAEKTLMEAGYSVHFITTKHRGRSYVNSMVMGSTVFMPVYQQRTIRDELMGRIPLDEEDQAAKIVFESLGFTVVPVPAAGLETKFGALHCLAGRMPLRPVSPSCGPN